MLKITLNSFLKARNKILIISEFSLFNNFYSIGIVCNASTERMIRNVSPKSNMAQNTK